MMLGNSLPTSGPDRNWQTIEVPLDEFAGKQTVLRRFTILDQSKEVCMKRAVPIAGAVALLSVIALSQDQSVREITRQELRDKIEGGWAGQMIGVSYGAPTEFRFRQAMVPDDKLPKWKPEMVSNALDQDDLYVDMTLAKVLDDKGLDATTDDFGAMFKEAKYRLWHANLAARRALKRGVPATLSGTPKYNAHANDIDFQIESDFIGLMSPGQFQWTNAMSWRAGRVMNAGDGIYGGMFISGMYAAAFFQNDTRKIVEAGLACLPARSPYAMVIKDVLRWSQENPDDWTKTWHAVNEKWDKREPCPEGALKPFNIDAKLNGAYVALGVLYGKGDFSRTIEVATKAGQDSDCNPSSACGIVGVMRGYKAIPKEWSSGIPPLSDQKFNFTDYTFQAIVDSTEKRALALIEKNGGRVNGDRITVRMQKPTAAKLELWDNYGSPVERVPSSDARWSWKGEWAKPPAGGRGGARDARVSSKKGAEAEIAFNGTGAIVTGPYSPNGGTAQVYLDGKLDRTVDVYPDEDNTKGGEAVWHAFGLKNGPHTIRLVVLGEPANGSKGANIEIEDLVYFR
jgi:hypothetical protein